MAETQGYRVGDRHPVSTRRQFHRLTDGEVSDLADAVVHALALELRRLDVAGGDIASTWELARQIRETVTEHHTAASRRAQSQRDASNG